MDDTSKARVQLCSSANERTEQSRILVNRKVLVYLIRAYRNYACTELSIAVPGSGVRAAAIARCGSLIH